MPITTTLRKFKKDTSRFMSSRSGLAMIDTWLFYYEHAISEEGEVESLTKLRRAIKRWAEGRVVVTEKGVTRYKAYDDPKGAIWRLEQEIPATLDEIVFRREVAAFRHVRQRYADEAAQRRHLATQGTLLELPVRNSPGPGATPRDVEQPNAGVHWGTDLPADAPIGGSAFPAAAALIQASINRHHTAAEVKAAVATATGRGVADIDARGVTMQELTAGIEGLGYNVDCFQRCTPDHIRKNMGTALPGRPILIAAETLGPKALALLCTGRTYNAPGRDQKQVFDIRDERPGMGAGEMDFFGYYKADVGAEVEHANLSALMGFIRVLS